MVNISMGDITIAYNCLWLIYLYIVRGNYKLTCGIKPTTHGLFWVFISVFKQVFC